MKIVAMIPARLEATRFPNKLMQDLEGMSVILRTYRTTFETGLFDAVYVVTDSDVIYNEIISNGGKAIISKKAHESGSDRIAEVIEDVDADVVINVQGDEPFTNKETLNKLIAVFKKDDNEQIDIASVMFEIKDSQEIQNPNNVKVVTDINDFALYFSRSSIPFQRDVSFGTFYKHIGIYAFRKNILLKCTNLPMYELEQAEKLEQLRFLGNGMRIKMVKTKHQPIGIDTPEDLEEARKQF
jgi:3-deoxy-D-manno-octulosonate cytidylyltransferase|tara:strand:- start:90209 stop:90931 length:723 start_codon:yes stop_codon:yes gene_type:complete